MLRKNLLISSAALSLLPVSALAQAAGDLNDEIVITSSRLNQTQSEIGSSVSVITQDDIEALGFDFAADAVGAASGVTVNQNGAFGGQATVRIRGAASGQTLVLIDGVAVNDVTSPAGSYDISSLDVDNIERIEVLKGPQSTLWGADAIGGVVSFITKHPEEGLGANGFAEIGSFNTRRGGVSVEGGTGQVDGRLSFSSIDTDGISKADEADGNSEEDGFSARTISARAGADIGTARLDVTVSNLESRAETDSFGIVDGPDLAKIEQSVIGATLHFPFAGDLIENDIYFGLAETDRINISAFGPFVAEGKRETARWQSQFNINAGNAFVLGFETEETQGVNNSGFDQDRATDSVFGLYEAKPLPGLTLTAGLRNDDISGYGATTTGRLAAAYAVRENLNLRATWGEGFKPPSLSQLSYISFVSGLGNPDLKPEESKALDIGLDYKIDGGRGQISVSYFNQDVDNKIEYSGATDSYFNIAGAETSGTEIDVYYSLTDWLNVSAAYAFIDAEDNTGSRLIGVPEHSGDITFGINPDGPLSGVVLLRYNGEETDISTATVDDWIRVDINSAYDLSKNVEFYGRIENLFDEQYQQVLGYGTPGASGYIGVKLRY